MLSLQVRQKLTGVFVKVTVLLNKAVKNRMEQQHKNSCVRLTFQYLLNILVSAYRVSLPFSQFQVSARATKAAVAVVSLHGWLEAW